MILFSKPIGFLGINRLISVTSCYCKISPKRKLTVTSSSAALASSFAKRSRLATCSFQFYQAQEHKSINFSSSSYLVNNTMSDIADLEEQVKKCRISVKEQVLKNNKKHTVTLSKVEFL